MANGILEPIDVRSVVTDINRPADAAKDISAWFRDEVLELNFGDTVGRPDSDITLQREYLARFLETGWVIDAVLERGDSGQWVNPGGSVTRSKSAELSAWDANSGVYITGDSDLNSITNPERSAVREVYDNNWDDHRGRPQSAYRDRPITASWSESTPSSTSPAYWKAYQKVRLKRRRLVAELVLQTMIASFNDAYNGGREIEDSRYNQVVSLYTLMLQRSEGEGNAIVSGAIDVTPLLNEVKTRILGAMDRTEISEERSSKFIVEDAIADINREFDAKIAQERARLITVGVYNSTMWPTTEAGYERQRAAAILKAKAEGEKAVFDIRKSSSETVSAVGVQLVKAAQEIADAADKRRISVVELRNSVLKWMLDYIGAREESYPELEEQEAMVQRLGFSVGSAGSVL